MPEYAPTPMENLHVRALERETMWRLQEGRMAVQQNLPGHESKRVLSPIEVSVFDGRSILLSLALCMPFAGCSPTDIHVHPKSAVAEASATLRLTEPRTPLATEFLEAAKLEGNSFPVNRVAEQHYLKVALDAWAALKAAKNESDPSLLEIHNQALADYVQLLSPGDLAIGQADEVVDGRHVRVILRDQAKPDTPPGFDQFIAAERLKIRGLRQRHVRTGLGARLVCQQEPDPVSVLSRYSVPEKQHVARSAVFKTVSPAEERIEILLVDPSKTERVELDGRVWPVGGDFSAPFAAIGSRTRFVFQRWQGLFRMEHYANRQGIFFLEPYDPEKIPVLMVHGILSSPLMWRDLTNRIMGDPLLQKKYQVWHYTYATGYPILTSARMLRQHLDGVNSALQRAGLPPHKPIVLIGHSMGGLIAKMMVSASHDLVWDQFFRVPPDQLNLMPADREWVENIMFFQPRHDISRVIFMASPFKGSKAADMILFRFSSRLVRFPADLQGHQYRVFRMNRSYMLVSKENRLIAERLPSSIDLLSPESPETIALGQLKVDPSIPFHLIIGVRHGSNKLRSSDGIVAYSSSYL
ncbi:MAG TPA: alpha/beta fold hydrolase, partial [Chthoniobacterales bacterium]|nr:alpha/beta fold hydrolase [Chthoniobacterales bacterium]